MGEIRSRVTRREFLRAGAALGGGFALAACAPGSTTSPSPTASSTATTGATATAETMASIEAAAQAEGGQVLWYNAGNPTLVKNVTEAFQKKYSWAKIQGVSVVFSEMPNKLVTENVTGAPTADVMWCPPTLRETWVKNDLLQKIAVMNDKNLPATTLDPDNWGHPVWQLLITIQYNTDLKIKPPTDPAQLADAAWNGKLAFDRVQNLGQSTTWLSVWRQKMGDAKWRTWLDAIAANKPFIAPNAGTVHDLVLRGERAIGLASSNYVLAQAQGAPAAMSFDIPPVPFFNHAYLLKRAAHPKSARLFMEWSATAEGQTAIASAGLSPIMDIDHPSALKRFLPAGVTPMSSADLADFANKTKEYTDILAEKFPG